MSFQHVSDLFHFHNTVNCFITLGCYKIICEHRVTMGISDWLAVMSCMCQYFSLKEQV